MSHQLLADPFDHVDRDCKADPFGAAAATADGSVDADDFAIEIQQRPAAVARIDRSIRLQKVLATRDPQAAALRADDSGGHCHADIERIADRQHPIANLRRVAVAETKSFQTFRILDSQNGNIRVLVHLHFTDDVVVPVMRADFDLVRAAHDMTVGQDDSRFVNHESRSHAARPR